MGLGVFGLFRSRKHERAAFALYNEAVRAARDPAFYTRLDVPDTLDGRFDLLGVHVFLLIDRLRHAPEPGPAVAQAVFDAMFADMDFNLREMGVGDMSVGKRNRQMWEAFHGRAEAYAAAVAKGDRTALSTALALNVWRGEAPPGSADSLAGIVLDHHAMLTAEPIEHLVAGELHFAAPLGMAA